MPKYYSYSDYFILKETYYAILIPNTYIKMIYYNLLQSQVRHAIIQKFYKIAQYFKINLTYSKQSLHVHLVEAILRKTAPTHLQWYHRLQLSHAT